MALVYAARHPERLSRLVLYGGYARGRMWRGPEARRHAEAMMSAIRAGWTDSNPTFRHLFSMLFLPDGTAEQMAWYDELQRRSTSAETAVRLYEARNRIDVLELAPRVTTPTLVAHARDDRVVPVEEGRLLAARIPDARFVLLESANHILLPDEPAWRAFRSELRAFLGTERATIRGDIKTLSAREVDVLELVAAGLGNEAIAGRLSLSVRTVERHLSNVYAKLRVSGKAGRTAAAVQFSELLRADRQTSPPGRVVAPMPAATSAVASSHAATTPAGGIEMERTLSVEPTQEDKPSRPARCAAAAGSGCTSASGATRRDRRSSSSTAGRNPSSAGRGRPPARSRRTSGSSPSTSAVTACPRRRWRPSTTSTRGSGPTTSTQSSRILNWTGPCSSGGPTEASS